MQHISVRAAHNSSAIETALIWHLCVSLASILAMNDRLLAKLVPTCQVFLDLTVKSSDTPAITVHLMYQDLKSASDKVIEMTLGSFLK